MNAPVLFGRGQAQETGRHTRVGADKAAVLLISEKQLDVVKVNVDESREVAMQYGVRSIPTLIVMRDGKIPDTTLGAMPKYRLAAFTARHIA